MERNQKTFFLAKNAPFFLERFSRQVPCRLRNAFEHQPRKSGRAERVCAASDLRSDPLSQDRNKGLEEAMLTTAKHHETCRAHARITAQIEGGDPLPLIDGHDFAFLQSDVAQIARQRALGSRSKGARR
jgi:hypothetical protein